MSSLIAIQKAIEATGIVKQDNSPINGYTLIITHQAMQAAEKSLDRNTVETQAEI